MGVSEDAFLNKWFQFHHAPGATYYGFIREVQDKSVLLDLVLLDYLKIMPYLRIIRNAWVNPIIGATFVPEEHLIHNYHLALMKG